MQYGKLPPQRSTSRTFSGLHRASNYRIPRASGGAEPRESTECLKINATSIGRANPITAGDFHCLLMSIARVDRARREKRPSQHAPPILASATTTSNLQESYCGLLRLSSVLRTFVPSFQWYEPSRSPMFAHEPASNADRVGGLTVFLRFIKYVVTKFLFDYLL